jgi:hypothetical protein
VKRRLQILAMMLLAAAAALPATSAATYAATADAPPTVTITTSRSTYSYGDAVHLVFDIDGTGSGKYFSVTVDGAKHPLVPEATTYDGTRSADAGAYVNFTVRAHIYDTDGTTEIATAVKTINVHAMMATNSLGFHGDQGKYAVFARGSSPTFESASLPAAPGQRCLRHVVQSRSAAGWRHVVTSACKVEGKQGRVAWRWHGKHASGVRFRVRPTFAGDKANLPSVGPWLYFRFR